jgi:hypothetical protein
MIAFDAVLEPMEWGSSVYTVIRVPDELVRNAEAEATRRVAGTVEGREVNLAITTAPALDSPFLWAGKSLQRAIGLEPGDVAHCELRPVDPDVVLLADDVAEALRVADRMGAWEALPPAQRRTRLVKVDAAAKPETRARRIAELITSL